jgi:hypothetical protein
MPVPKELNIQTVTYINKTGQSKCAVSILKTSNYLQKIDMVLDVHSGETKMNGANRNPGDSIVELFISTHFNIVTVLGYT